MLGAFNCTGYKNTAFHILASSLCIEYPHEKNQPMLIVVVLHSTYSPAISYAAVQYIVNIYMTSGK